MINHEEIYNAYQLEIRKIQKEYDKSGYELGYCNLIYNFVTMEGFPRDLKYLNKNYVKENMTDKALEALKRTDQYKRAEQERDSWSLFNIVAPVLNEFFKDIETDVEKIFDLIQRSDRNFLYRMFKDNKYQLFVKSKSNKYKLNDNCIFFRNIRYNKKNFKVNTSFELSKDEAMKETKEFIRSFLIAVTMFGYRRKDRDGTLTHEFAVITDIQYSPTNYLLRNFILVGNGEPICGYCKEQHKMNGQNGSFAHERAAAGCIEMDHMFCISVGSYLFMISKEFMLHSLDRAENIRLEKELLIEQKTPEGGPRIVYIIIIIILVILVIYFIKFAAARKKQVDINNNQ